MTSPTLIETMTIIVPMWMALSLLLAYLTKRTFLGIFTWATVLGTLFVYCNLLPFWCVILSLIGTISLFVMELYKNYRGI